MSSPDSEIQSDTVSDRVGTFSSVDPSVGSKQFWGLDESFLVLEQTSHLKRSDSVWVTHVLPAFPHPDFP